jgi:UDP-N-acetylmuramoylalanine--D-glutamate ligase
LARWLSLHGARVTMSDVRGEDDLHVARESLAEYPIQWALGGHPLELLDSTDVLCLSGGIPLTLPIVAEAMKRGIPLSNDSQIFMEIVPCKTIRLPVQLGRPLPQHWLEIWRRMPMVTRHMSEATSAIH